MIDIESVRNDVAYFIEKMLTFRHYYNSLQHHEKEEIDEQMLIAKKDLELRAKLLMYELGGKTDILTHLKNAQKTVCL